MNDQSDSEAPSAGRAALRGRVLYVDDDAVYADLFTRLLDRLGYAVMACRDRAGALDALRMLGDHCSIFVSDCHLFGEDGIELACEVARAYPGIAVGVVSNQYEEIAMRALARGVPAAVKPENRDECAVLLARLNHHKAN